MVFCGEKRKGVVAEHHSRAGKEKGTLGSVPGKKGKKRATFHARAGLSCNMKRKRKKRFEGGGKNGKTCELGFPDEKERNVPLPIHRERGTGKKEGGGELLSRGEGTCWREPRRLGKKLSRTWRGGEKKSVPPFEGEKKRGGGTKTPARGYVMGVGGIEGKRLRRNRRERRRKCSPSA